MLFLLAFDSGGFIVGVQLRQWIHKAVVAAIHRPEALTGEILSFRISKNRFDEIKIHEREFRLEGRMYDIIWKETNGEELVIYCYRDKAEEKLIAKILGYLANKTKNNIPATETTIQSHPYGLVITVPEYVNTILPLPLRGLTASYHHCSIISRQHTVELPPPKNLLI